MFAQLLVWSVWAGSLLNGGLQYVPQKEDSSCRMRQLLNDSFTSGPIGEMERPAAGESPSHLTFDRIHGGVR